MIELQTLHPTHTLHTYYVISYYIDVDFFSFSPFPFITAPPSSGKAPYRTPLSNEKDPIAISISFTEDFFLPIYGPVASYAVLVAEEPDFRKKT